MDSCPPPSRLTPLQRDRVAAFFAREQRFFLTGGAEPIALGWVLEPIAIGPEAALPGGADPARLLAFRDDLVKCLRAIAFRQAQGA